MSRSGHCGIVSNPQRPQPHIFLLLGDARYLCSPHQSSDGLCRDNNTPFNLLNDYNCKKTTAFSLPPSLLWFQARVGSQLFCLRREHVSDMIFIQICFFKCWWDPTQLPDELEQRDLQLSASVFTPDAAKRSKESGDPFVPRWASPTPRMLNKHSQTSGQLTPATGIPLVCLDDGGPLFIHRPLHSCWEANEKAGRGGRATRISAICLLALNKYMRGGIFRRFVGINIWLTREWGGEGKKINKLERSSACVSSPAKPMRESVSASTAAKRVPASAAAAVSQRHATLTKNVYFCRWLNQYHFWQDLLEHASLFYAIPSLSPGSIHQPAGALSPNGDCSLVRTW